MSAYEGEKARFACAISLDSPSADTADYTTPDYWTTADTGELTAPSLRDIFGEL